MENLIISSIGLEFELNRFEISVSSIGLEFELNRFEISVSSIGLEFEILEPPLFNDKTYTVYVGNTEIPNIYVGNNLLTDISFIIT